ncbi:MAG: efflux RND transporter periplasmic adaptor subunit [Archangium sp.]|nr:efflux RND transporter periplasmic adaptor subunit [Archangium sp.]
MNSRTKAVYFIAAVTLLSCSKSAGSTTEQAPPPSPVQVKTLETKRLEEGSEYLATLTSRRAVSLYPQVSGYVRAILAKPGTTVRPGAVLLQIDSTAEQATMQNMLATHEALAASASFAKDRQARSKLLRGDGIVSQQDADQSQVLADQAEASVRANDALIASQRARLAFFTISAPLEGVVGNVPVKVGDFVTPATLLTSVTQDTGLEAEVLVPVERSTSLTPSSRIRLLNGDGEAVAESAVVFVSPRADPTTQLLLIKGAFDAMPAMRADQVVRARVIWSMKDGLAVPTVAVIRQAGQPFVYVVETPDGGGPLAARRIPVTLGSIQGGEYTVVEGLRAGQRVVVSGIQTIGDGSLVELQSDQPSAGK